MGEDSALHALCTPVVLAVTGVAVLLGYLAFPSAAERAVRHLPQPATTLPIVYNTFDIMFRYPGRIYDFLLDETRKQNGQIWRVKAMGRPVTIVLTSPAAFEHVLKTKFEDFGKGELNSITLYDVLGKGIFAVDGMLWMHQRKTASHLFSLQMMRDTMEHTVMHYTEILCERLAEIAETKETVNIKRMLDLFTMDVFTKIGFGVDLHGLESNENPELLDAFERASLNLLSRFQVPVWSWQLLKWLNIGKEKQMAKDVKVINDFTLNVIKRSMGQARTKSDADTKSKDLISLFLEKESTGYSNGEYNGSVDTDATLIRDMTMSFLAAGRDTTSQSMAWFILMLNRSPSILARVRQEIYDKLPKLRNGAAITSVPSMEDVQQLTFLEAALRESIRLNPVVAMNARTALRDTTLHDGTFIKAGTRVALPHYAMARLTQVWGDDAEVYNPDRWIDPATGKLIEVSPFKFTAFLGGPRMCLGMKFALLEMKIAMAAVLSKFDFTTERDPMAYTYRPSITLTIRGPVNVTVRSVDAASATEQ